MEKIILSSQAPVDRAPCSHKPYGSGIRTRLLLLLLYILLPILAIQAFIYYETYLTARTREMQANLEIARAISKAFDAFVQDVLHQELAIALAATSKPPLCEKDFTRLLQESAKAGNAISAFSWVSPEGRILACNLPEAIGATVANRSYFQEILSGREWCLSDLLIGKLTGEPLFTINRGIRDEAGNLLGMVSAIVIPGKLDSILGLQRAKESSVSLWDRQGMLVYRYPHMSLTWEERGRLKHASFLKQALDGEEVTTITTPSYEDKLRFIALTPTGSGGWVTRAGRQEEEAIGPIKAVLVRQGGWFLLVTLFASLVAVGVSRTITNPVRKLQRYAIALRQGNLEGRVELSGPTEMVDLADTLNHTVEEIGLLLKKANACASEAEKMAAEAEEGRRILEILMEHVPEGITIADAPDVRIRMMSRYGQELIGRPEEGIEGIPFDQHTSNWGIYYPDGITAARQEDLPLARAIHQGEVIANEEFLVERPDGRKISILCNACPIQDKNGRITGSVIAWRDITKYKRLEEEIREREATLRAFFDSNQVYMSIMELVENDLAYVLANQQLADFYGLSIHELTGKQGKDLGISDETIRYWYELAWRCHETGKPVSTEFSVPYKGKMRWYQGTLSSIAVKSSPRLRFGVAAIDITERKRAENKLKESEKRERAKANELETVLDAVPIAVFIAHDTECRHMTGNRAAYELVRVPHGINPSKSAPEDERPQYRIMKNGVEIPVEDLPMQQTAVTGMPIFGTSWTLGFEDGTECHILGNAAPLFDMEGRPRGAVGAFLDITEQMRMVEELRSARDELDIRVKERTEELERANEQLREVPARLLFAQEEERKRLASELHDSVVQTLAALKFRVETVLATRDRENSEAALKLLEKFIPVLQRSIDETRSIYMGLRPMILEDMGLIATLEWFCREMHGLYPQYHIELEIGEIEEWQIPEPLKIAIFRIAQEALNNVFKHSKAEWVDFTLLTKDDGIELTIQDDGVGVDLTYIRESSTARSLGLISMNERAELTGGTLSLESTPGEGTTIRAFWPIAI